MRVKIETSIMVARQVDFMVEDNYYFSDRLTQTYSNVWESEDMDEDEREEFECALEEMLAVFGSEVDIIWF